MLTSLKESHSGPIHVANPTIHPNVLLLFRGSEIRLDNILLCAHNNTTCAIDKISADQPPTYCSLLLTVMYILTVEERRNYETIAVNPNNTLQARMEAHFWVGYCYAELTGGIVRYRTSNLEQEHRQAHRWWQRALDLLQRPSADGGDEQEGPNDNTGKIRYRLELYQDAIPRLQYESDNNGDNESQYYLAECHYIMSIGMSPT